MPEPTARHRAAPRPIALLVTALLVTACGGATATRTPTGAPPSDGPPPSTAPNASPVPAVGSIDHPTGATDVILRLEQGGGFVPMEFNATQAPSFTLFGNGVIVFQPMTTTVPEPDPNGVVRATPWRTAKFDEGQIQELLEFALGLGGLGGARASYPATGVADAPDTIFTIQAGGLTKRVAVNALGIDTQPGPDAAARLAFSMLATRLQDFDGGGSIPSDVYAADRHRGILTERDATIAGPLLDWPWPAFEPSDFKPGAADGSGGPTLPHRTMTADDVAALKLTGIEGGVQGLAFKGPDGKRYNFFLRPLLVDEKE